MRILLVGAGRLPIPPPGYGGMERYIAEYAVALRRSGQTVRILNEIRPGVYTQGWTFERHLPFLLRRHTEEVVHVNTSRTGVVLALAGVPFVYTTHNPYWFEPRNALQRVLFENERFAVRYARASVAFTDRLRERMGRVRPRRGPVVTIPLGVDTEKFRAHGPGDPGRALGVGEVSERKRWHVAARALQGSPVRLTIVGPIRDPVYAATLRGLGAELAGEVPEAELLAAFDASGMLVHPSEKEALPGVVLQAMAFGRPVIGGHAIASIDGVLAAPSEDEATAIAFIRQWAGRFNGDERLRREEGARARRSAEANYSWGRIVEHHLALYREVMGAGAA